MQTDRCLACLFVEVDQQIISWLQCDYFYMLLIVEVPKDGSPFFFKETFASIFFSFVSKINTPYIFSFENETLCSSFYLTVMREDKMRRGKDKNKKGLV